MAESENRVSSCIGSSFELEGDLRCFGKPITVFFHVVSVAGRDYGFLRCLSDLDPGLGVWLCLRLPHRLNPQQTT